MVASCLERREGDESEMRSKRKERHATRARLGLLLRDSDDCDVVVGSLGKLRESGWILIPRKMRESGGGG